MQRSVKGLEDHSILATDGEIGSVQDVLFDDDDWHVRYFVVKTGPWLFGREVLLSPVCVTAVQDGQVAVQLTKDQVKDSPDIVSDPPLSRQNETDIHDHYQWPHYWMPDARVNQALLSPEGGTALVMGGGVEIPEGTPVAFDRNDPNLRSARSVIGYEALENGNSMGKIVDVLYDDSTWLVTALVIGDDDDRDASGRTIAIELVERMGPPEEVVELKAGAGTETRH